MNRRKWNNHPWYTLGLALLLCAAALAAATVPAQARYKKDRQETLVFQVRSPAQVCLGTLKTVAVEEEKKTEEETGPEATESEETTTEETEPEGTDPKETKTVFDPKGKILWETVTEDEVYLLNFAVANGTSEKVYSERKQKISIRLISSVGITENTILSLRLPPETEDGEERIIQAIATRIEPDTNLYMTNGEGFIYTFHEMKDDGETIGEELTWILPGGELAYIPITIAMTGALPEHPSLVQPLVMADLTA